MTSPAPKSTGTIAAPTGARYARIMGVGGYRPERVVPNSEIIEAIDSSDEWIRQRTGIITRKRASKGVNAIDLAETASLEALKNAGVAASDIDAVIVSTISNVAVTPSMSALLAERIGAAPAPKRRWYPHLNERLELSVVHGFVTAILSMTQGHHANSLYRPIRCVPTVHIELDLGHTHELHKYQLRGADCA